MRADEVTALEADTLAADAKPMLPIRDVPLHATAGSAMAADLVTAPPRRRPQPIRVTDGSTPIMSGIQGLVSYDAGQALYAGAEAVSTFSTIGGAIQTAQILLQLAKVLPDTQAQLDQDLKTLSAQLDSLAGALSWQISEKDREDRLALAISAVTTGAETLQLGQPLTMNSAAVLQSLNQVNAAKEAVSFWRLNTRDSKQFCAEGTDPKTDGAWKLYILDRPDAVGDGGMFVMDWRMAVPSLVELIGMRIDMLAAVDPGFATDGAFAIELAQHRDFLLTEIGALRGEVRCGVTYDEFSNGQAGDWFSNCPTRVATGAGWFDASQELPNSMGFRSLKGGRNPDASCQSTSLHFHVACADINTGLSQTADLVEPYTYPLDLASTCYQPSEGTVDPGCVKLGQTDYAKWFAQTVQPIQDSIRRNILNAMPLFDLQDVADGLDLLVAGSNHELTRMEHRIPSAANPALCLSVQGRSSAAGAGVTLAPCASNDPSQVWAYDRKGQAIVETTYDECLDVQGESSAPGALAVMAACSGAAGQRWTWNPTTRVLTNALGNVLDVQNGNVAAGTLVQTWALGGGPGQQWSSGHVKWAAPAGDILWRDDGGNVAIWRMTPGTGALASKVYPPAADASWKIQGTGDFDGDGQTDILWRNTNGVVAIWFMSNGAVRAQSYPGTPDASWQIKGTGDFDGDGQSDILWQNTSGAVSIWFSGATNRNAYPATVDSSWQIKGTGDFDGDGQSDILWRNTSGAVSIWFSGSTQRESYPGAPDLSWDVQGTGDFDGDGRSDILWRRWGGAVSIWFSGNTQRTYDPAAPDNTWQVQRIGDFDGDGQSDVLWRQTTSTNLSIWFSGDTKRVYYPGTVPSTWHVQGALHEHL